MSGGTVLVEGIPLTFTVGRDTREDTAVKAVRGLRELAELGAQAARALERLERDGFIEHPVPLVWRSGDEQKIQRLTLPERLPVTEADLPALAEWELAAVSSYGDKFCGHPVTLVNFQLSVPGRRQVRSDMAVYRDVGRQTGGNLVSVRIGKRAVTVICGGREAAASSSPEGSPPTEDWKHFMQTVSNAAGGLAVQVAQDKKTKTALGEHAKTSGMRALARRLFLERHADAVLRTAVRDSHAAAVMLS